MNVEVVNNLYFSVAEIKVNPNGFMNYGCCTLMAVGVLHQKIARQFSHY